MAQDRIFYDRHIIILNENDEWYRNKINDKIMDETF